MTNKLYLFACCLLVCYAEATSSDDGATVSEKIRIRLPKETEKELIKVTYDCVSNFSNVPCFFKAFRGDMGPNYNYNQRFKNETYCLFTEMGLAAKETGKIDVQKVVALYPNTCNATEVVEKCSAFEGMSSVETLAGFYICNLKINPCVIDALPAGM